MVQKVLSKPCKSLLAVNSSLLLASSSHAGVGIPESGPTGSSY